MKLRAPTPGNNKLGHYKTFLKKPNNENPQFGDYGQPTSTEKQLGACEGCPAYQFSFATEKQRLYSLFHCRQTGPLQNAKDFVCQHENCGQQFGSVSALNQHKKPAKHTARDTRLLNGPPKKKKKGNNNGKKLKSIKSACRIISDSESCDDDSSQCFANPCLIRTDLNVEDPLWVCCDSCNEWMHAFCVSFGEKSAEDLKSDFHVPKKFLFICFDESPLKMMKNAFHFISQALFVLKIFKVLS